ncbi:hypothetical protein CYLTODRAFT_273838 [Cylindrobasidium torrendii FP15055 ss-10]|uniref:F-box domain-containing protein n=1 Tax=Cylindrobasidium torrendii FP15055 ss-10 TaxID=1314674 RepID=A0A0D7BCY0_9AGAR|nr:hypothetical protein CYLTODRAFT_273838 [Cylindrobasidium torrendii FP15055 ss-10]
MKKKVVSYVGKLTAEVNTLEMEVAAMSEALAALAAQYESARKSLEIHSGLLCRFHDLPVEVLSQIFMSCLDDRETGRYSVYGKGAPWNLTAVCRRWRQISCALPKLWSAPSFQFSVDAIKSCNFFPGPSPVALAFQRSENTRLAMDVELDGPEAIKCFESLQAFDPPLRSLSVRGHPRQFTAGSGRPFLRNFFLGLRKLSVTAMLGSKHNLPLDNHNLLDWGNMLWFVYHDKSLYELELLVDGDDYSFYEMRLETKHMRRFSQLKVLKLHTDTNITLSMLRSCPQITSLELSGKLKDKESNLDSSISVDLPDLCTLYIHRAERLTKHLRCPGLKSLVISAEILPTDLLPMLGWIASLERLDIWVSPDHASSDAWGSIHNSLVHLKDLTLRAPIGVFEIVLPKLSEAAYFPSLTTLALNIPDDFAEVLERREAEVAFEQFLDARVIRTLGRSGLVSMNVTFEYSWREEGADIDLTRSTLIKHLKAWKDDELCRISAVQIYSGRPLGVRWQDLLGVLD